MYDVPSDSQCYQSEWPNVIRGIEIGIHTHYARNDSLIWTYEAPKRRNKNTWFCFHFVFLLLWIISNIVNLHQTNCTDLFIDRCMARMFNWVSIHICQANKRHQLHLGKWAWKYKCSIKLDSSHLIRIRSRLMMRTTTHVSGKPIAMFSYRFGSLWKSMEFVPTVGIHENNLIRMES